MSVGGEGRALLDALLVALFPPRCGACDDGLAAWPRFGLCPSCLDVLEANDGSRCVRCDLPGTDLCDPCADEPPVFSALRAPYLYGGALAELLIAAKFAHREDLAAAAGRLLAADSVARGQCEGAGALVPVPLGRSRQRSRGYNQSAIVARVVGRAFGLPVRYALQRARNTTPQSDLSLERRRENVASAFAARGSWSGQRLVLVDDVVTSAHTVREAAMALRNAGAEDVTVLAVARAP